MSLNIPKSIKKEFSQSFDDYIKFNGRQVFAYLDPTKADCPNCLRNNIEKTSTNVYNTNFIRPVNIFPGTSFQKTIFPVPFNVTTVSGIQYDPSLINPKILMTSVCPVCRGDGVLIHENRVCFIGLVTVGKSGSPGFEDLSAGIDGSQFARIKTFSSNYAICRESKYFIIDGIKYKTIVPARLKGLGSLSITEIFLAEIEEGDSVNTLYDLDSRTLNSDLGQISNQASSGTPTIPPIIPGDDVW